MAERGWHQSDYKIHYLLNEAGEIIGRVERSEHDKVYLASTSVNNLGFIGSYLYLLDAKKAVERKSGFKSEDV